MSEALAAVVGHDATLFLEEAGKARATNTYTERLDDLTTLAESLASDAEEAF